MKNANKAVAMPAWLIEKTSAPFFFDLTKTAVRIWQCDPKTPEAAWPDHLVTLPRVGPFDHTAAQLVSQLDIGAKDLEAVWVFYQRLAKIYGWDRQTQPSGPPTINYPSPAEFLQGIGLAFSLMSRRQLGKFRRLWPRHRALVSCPLPIFATVGESAPSIAHRRTSR